MATRRTTSDKRQRERAKQAKAAAKRERRQERSSGGGEDTVDETDAGELSFEDFDEQKSELVDRIALRLAQ